MHLCLGRPEHLTQIPGMERDKELEVEKWDEDRPAEWVVLAVHWGLWGSQARQSS